MKKRELTNLLKESVRPALGCTEPIAIAYALAKAKTELSSEIKKVEILVSLNIYKNAARVGIPGTTYKGPMMAAALSLVMGDYQKELKVIENLDEADIKKAQAIIDSGLIKLKVLEEVNGIYIETRVESTSEKARVIIIDNHLNIVKTEKIDANLEFETYQIQVDRKNDFGAILDFSLADILAYIKEVPLAEIKFLQAGVDMNLKVAAEGLKTKNSLSSKFEQLIATGFLNDNLLAEAKMKGAAASEARMNGSKLPIMSSAGSGNQGIVNFITNAVVAEAESINQEKLLRALALSNLLTLYIKTATGSLSAMCGVAVAAGVGVSASTVYLLGGGEEEILAASLNVLASLTGIVCDGAKEGCAYKVATAVDWSLISAKLAIAGKSVDHNDGILAASFEELIDNLAYVCQPGMIETDQAILKVMQAN